MSVAGDLTPSLIAPSAPPPSGPAPDPLPDNYKLPPLKIDNKPLPAPDMRTEYHLADGRVAFVVCRWNGNSERRKHFSPATFVDGKIRWRGYPSPRPLLNLPALNNAPTAPVLIVEGEKAATAAAKYVPDGWLITTWAGGVNALAQTDWVPLADHRCVIWPDHDTSHKYPERHKKAGEVMPYNEQPGMACALAISKRLDVLRVPNSVVVPPSSLPDGWDLADPLPPGVEPRSVTRMLERALAACQLPDGGAHYVNGHSNGHSNGHHVEQEVIAPEFSASGHPNIAGHGLQSGFVALGTNAGNSIYYFFSTETKRLIEVGADKLNNDSTILRINSDYGWWRAAHLKSIAPKDNLEAFTSREVKHLGNILRIECHKSGIFNDGRIRKRGVWFDQGSVVTHVGHEVWMDGNLVDPATIISDYIYPLREPRMKISGTKPMTTAEGMQIVGIAKNLKWDHPIYADLLCGLIATSPICGALSWRTHGIVTGPRGCGKSWVVLDFVGKVLGEFAIKVLGETTAAGLRQELKSERLPVLFDESESNSGERGAARIDQIIEVMRSASKSTDAVVLKGSASHDAHSFSLHAVFILGCIGIPIHKAADLSRTVVMTLQGAAALDDQERAQRSTHFSHLTALLDRLPGDVSEKLLRRMSRMVHVVQANAETFRRLIAEKYADSRTGDQLGVLFAGRYALQYDGIIPVEIAEKYVAEVDWALFKEAATQREDSMLLNHMAAEVVRVEGRQAQVVSRTLGELIGIACSVIQDEYINAADARSNLQRYGLRAVMGMGDVPGFIMHNTHPFLDRVFSKSDYPRGYYEIIARARGVTRGLGNGQAASMSIGAAGNKRTFIWIPADLVCGADDGVE